MSGDVHTKDAGDPSADKKPKWQEADEALDKKFTEEIGKIRQLFETKHFVTEARLHTFEEHQRTKLEGLAVAPLKALEATVAALQVDHDAVKAKVPVILAETNAVTQQGWNELASFEGADFVIVTLLTDDDPGRGEAVLLFRGDRKKIRYRRQHPPADVELELKQGDNTWRLMAQGAVNVPLHYIVVRY